MTCGAGAAIMVGISTAVSVATQGIQDAIKGEFLGLYAYFGVAIGDAISGLGQGLGTRNSKSKN